MMVTIPTLKTERLTLRPLLKTDDQQIFALRSNQSVNQYLSRKPRLSIDDARRFIQAILDNQAFYWAITLTGGTELTGTVCLFNLSDDHQKAELGYELLPEFQGKGFMQEAVGAMIDFAFRRLNVSTIQAYTHVENQASSQLLEKLNFEECDVDEEVMVLFSLMRNE